jgi:hypothetical protein
VSVALVIHHVKGMPPIITSRVVLLVLPYFPHFLINNAIELEMGVLIFSTTFVRKMSHTKKKLTDNVVNVCRYICTVPVILARF